MGEGESRSAHTAALPGELTLTVAVKVTDWPNLLGLTEEVSAVVVSALLTTWLSTLELESLKLLSPPYWAVIEWLAVLSVLVLKVAVVIPAVVDAPPLAIQVSPS